MHEVCVVLDEVFKAINDLLVKVSQLYFFAFLSSFFTVFFNSLNIRLLLKQLIEANIEAHKLDVDLYLLEQSKHQSWSHTLP